MQFQTNRSEFFLSEVAIIAELIVTGSCSQTVVAATEEAHLPILSLVLGTKFVWKRMISLSLGTIELGHINEFL